MFWEGARREAWPLSVCFVDVRKHGGKLPIKPSKKFLDAFLREIHNTILALSKGMTREQLIHASQSMRLCHLARMHTCDSRAFVSIAQRMM